MMEEDRIMWDSRYLGGVRAGVRQQAAVARLKRGRGQMHGVPIASDAHDLVHAEIPKLLQY